MHAHNFQSNHFNLGKKFSISRESSNDSSITGNKKAILPRCNSSGNPNVSNHHNGFINSNLKYKCSDSFLNSQNINKDYKSINELNKTKVSYKQSYINEKENENKYKSSNNHSIFGAIPKSNNNNSKFQNNINTKNGPVIMKKNFINFKKTGIVENENNYNYNYSNFNYKQRPNSFQKKKDENYNPNNNNIESLLNYNQLKNEAIKPKILNNKYLNDEQYKVMNKLKEKEKKSEFNLNINESKINEQLNEMKELKKLNEKYEFISNEKDKEINCFKQKINELIKSNEKYESIIKEKNNGINQLKQKIIELIKTKEKYESIIKEKNNGINYLQQKINGIEKSNEIYDSEIKKKDSEINSLKQKINELNIIINQCINFKNKEQELKKREIEINEREEEFNKKISFLEDKENQLENEIKEKQKMIVKFQNDIEENKKIKIENNNLILKNQKLQKENQEFESNKEKFQKENAILNQKNIELNSQIKKLENMYQLHKKSKSFDCKKINRVIPKPLDSYNSPTLIGLNNIGATCFMNSTLQCLSQTKALTNYFLNIKNKEAIKNNNIALKNKNDYQLSPVFSDLIQKLWEINGPSSFSPNTFMNTVNNMNPLFKTGQAGDAKDFIIFILEQLHKELKKSVQSNSIKTLQLNQYDKNNAFNYFFNDFKKEYSVISDIFFGFNETTNICLNCKNIYNSKGYNNPICYNYGIFNCLIFPLEEVKNMKNNSMQYNNIQINSNIVSLYDCFYYNQKSELFTGGNRNYCNICKQLYDSIYTSTIFISPIILVIILNRGKGNIYDVKLDFSETIDITQFVQQKDCPQLIYNLYGVITHIGQSGPNAHFVASCKSPIDNQWYRYNDAFVNPINNLQKEVIEFGTPYILFYMKNN